MTEEILSVLNGEVFGVWFLIGAALVFWMQAGFAMVETGFTRAKNAGNILMKNLMDFCAKRIAGNNNYHITGYGRSTKGLEPYTFRYCVKLTVLL